MKHFAVIGHPIDHSASPKLHQAAFDELEIDATFEAVEVLPKNLEAWMKAACREYHGVAVTVPHKEAILNYIDAPTDSAIAIGAVNTLYFDQGKLIGTNTDGIGALKAIETQMPHLKGKRALVLGAGGAAKAIIFALRTAEAHTAVWNRTTEKAKKLADDFEVGHVEDLTEQAFGLFDLVINATSVGLRSQESVVPADFWQAGQVAFDIVYDPLETRFLQDAEAAGCETITGDKMLVYQAIEQFKIWHGVEVEREVMEGAFFGM